MYGKHYSINENVIKPKGSVNVNLPQFSKVQQTKSEQHKPGD
jgi:hypothetical protein